MMLLQRTDSPRHNPPQPSMVYVYEKQAWEYKIVVKNAREDESGGVLLPEQELNALGQSGWELAGIVTLPTGVQFYFKRLRDARR